MSYVSDIETLSESDGTASHVTLSNDTERSVGSINYSLPDQSVSNQPLTGGHAVTRSYTKTPHYLPLAVIVSFVNPPFGIVAVLFSVLSRRSSRNDDVERARKRAGISMWLSIIGIASAMVIMIFVLVYFFVITPNIIRSIDELQTWNMITVNVIPTLAE